MNFIKRILVLIYVTLITILAYGLIMFALNWLSLPNISKLLYIFYIDENLRLGVAIAGCVLIFINFLFYKIFTINIHRDKIIAFDNPSGRVTVSLLTLEDIIKRMIIKEDEIREVKVNLIASKKTLWVKIKLVLKAEVNIPEVTARIQDMVKAKIQDIIGLEEKLDIAVYVGRILPEQIKADRSKDNGKNPHVPFQGYRA